MRRKTTKLSAPLATAAVALVGRSRAARTRRRGACLAVGASLATAVWWAAAGSAAGQERRDLGVRAAAVYNLAGRVAVVPGNGPNVVVEIARGGAAADRLRVEVSRVRGRESLRVLYPADRIVYRRTRGSTTTMRVRGDGTFFGGGRGGREVLVSGRGRGLEAHADLVVRVPAGGDVAVYLGAGEVSARGRLEAGVSVATGAGGVDVEGVRGDVSVDTGSGRVSVRGVAGRVRVDTGSGAVRVDDVTGPSLEVDTGSGAVEGSGVTAETVRVDTGSGRIRFDGLAAPRVECDTGSGSVHLSLAADVERLLVDTGSGGVTLLVPRQLGAELRLDSGSGRVRVDAPGAVIDVSKRGYLRGTLGDGVGRIVVDTGAGAVRVRGK